MRKRVAAFALTVVAVVATVAIVSLSQKNDSSNQNQSISSRLSYVALGDSIAAGVGLPNYSDASACNRTRQSYPEQLAKGNQYELVNVACSGATIPKGINGEQVVNNLSVDSQLSVLFSQSETPDVISLTVGANDSNWTQFAACYTSDCPSGLLQKQLSDSLPGLRDNLSAVLTAISQKYSNNMPKVLVTGYYQFVSNDVAKACDSTTGLDVGEKRQVRQVVDLLNDTIEEATLAYQMVTFVSIDFSGHELCSPEPWVQDVTDKAPFHPTESGQSAIASQITTVVK